MCEIRREMPKVIYRVLREDAENEYIIYKGEKYTNDDYNYYYNYGTDFKLPHERIEGWKERYTTGGGGMMDGRAYEQVVIKKNGKIYQVDYYLSRDPVETYIGNTIVWTTNRQKDGCGRFWVFKE